MIRRLLTMIRRLLTVTVLAGAVSGAFFVPTALAEDPVCIGLSDDGPGGDPTNDDGICVTLPTQDIGGIGNTLGNAGSAIIKIGRP